MSEAVTKMPELLESGQINKNIEKCVKAFGPGSKNLALLNETAFQCLLHASRFGDVTKCRDLFLGLGGSKDGKKSAAAIRVEAMKTYFSKMGPIVAEKGEWKIKKGVDWRDPSVWSLELAMSKPFWEFEAEKSGEFDFDAILNLIKGLPKRIEKAEKEGQIKHGDPTAMKAFAANIVSFAEEKAKLLTPGQRGKVDPNLAIIKNTVEVPASQVN